MRFQSIRSRLAFFAITAIAIIFIAKTIFLVNTEIKNYHAELEKKMTFSLNLGESSLRAPLWDMNIENMNDILDMILTDVNVVKVTILDERGAVIISKQKADFKDKGQSIIVNEQKIIYEKKPIGSIKVTLWTKYYELQLENKIITELIFSLIEILLLGLVIWFISDRITSPIEKLMLVADRIANGDLDAEFEKVSEDEVGRLGASLESMQRQLREQIGMLAEDHDEISALYEETTAMNDELSEMLNVISKNYEDTVQALANAIEANDTYTKGHCERVREYAVILARAKGLSQAEQDELSKSAILHDIGKIGVPSEVLNKETKLTEEEFELIKKHSQIGYQIVNKISFFEGSCDVILQHHERVDGKGYPQGLLGGEIHILARILMIADSYDAMTSSRAYRKTPFTKEQAILELERGKEKQFDSKLVDLFIGCVKNEEI